MVYKYWNGSQWVVTDAANAKARADLGQRVFEQKADGKRIALNPKKRADAPHAPAPTPEPPPAKPPGK